MAAVPVAAGVVAVLPAIAAVVESVAVVLAVTGPDVAAAVLVATGVDVVIVLPAVTGLDALALPSWLPRLDCRRAWTSVQPRGTRIGPAPMI